MKAAKGINYKKVLLFLVEGATDRVALENILVKNIKDKKVCFKVARGDLTSEESTTPENAPAKIGALIKDFLSRSPAFKKSDIIEVAYITDLDGVFLAKKRVVYDKDVELLYEEKCIKTSKSFAIIERNDRKAAVLRQLCSLDSVYGVPFSIYYFSVNLEHALFGKSNNSDAEKESAAFKFAKRFCGNEEVFLDFLGGEGITKGLEYGASWSHAEQGVNSLKRATNIDVLIKKYKR